MQHTNSMVIFFADAVHPACPNAWSACLKAVADLMYATLMYGPVFDVDDVDDDDCGAAGPSLHCNSLLPRCFSSSLRCAARSRLTPT